MSETLRQAHEHIQAGRVPEAIAALQRGVAEDADPFQIMVLHAGLLMKQRDFNGALDILGRAAVLRPLDYTVHYNAGLCLYEEGRFSEATDAYHRSLYRNAGYAKTWMKLGGSYLPQQMFPEALACQERAVGLDPEDAELRIALGTTVSLFGDDAGAAAQYRRSLELNQTAFEAEVALGFVLLRSGQWDEGWRRFEARWQIRPFGKPWDHQGKPFWTGKPEDMRGKCVMLGAEQGHGDTLQFLRYASLVAEFADFVFLAVPHALERIAATLGFPVSVSPPMGMMIPVREPDIVIPVMSLPYIFGTTPDNCPPPAQFDVPIREVPAKIGLCWHGDARPHDPIANADDRRRSIPWDQFAPIADVAPVISLQKEDLEEWGCRDWVDTAAIVKGLDLVITVDTAMAHLAGSLGVETWLLARAGGCWRWLSRGDTTCWYPTMRIYRQPVLMDWGPVIARVVADLKDWSARHGCPAQFDP
jgi:tetratricopeptide (TPR) repeat protein